MLAPAGRASAEPILVTGGSTFLYWDSSGSNVTLLGDGLRVMTDSYGGGLTFLTTGLRRLDGQLLFGSIGSAPHIWSVTIDGVDYSAYLSGSLAFATDPAVVPPLARNQEATVTAPFTMMGTLRGTTGVLGTGDLVFEVALQGAGTASASGFGADTNLLRIGGVHYQFAAAPAATPEPATLLLMGTGLAGVLLRRRAHA
ncbi:MAG TPA: PEP-CTERM sorting domain-containing protein [Vicinamibacterales bacterium]|nr:PEP-CTERM sorting domain-containing protein [Vicinamibacterales bacterium]